MKKIIFLTAIIISIINIALAQNQYDITEINTSANPISYVLDISFVDYNTGYLTAEYYIYSGGNYTGDKNYVFKTTNGGINWLKIWENTYGINSKNLSVSFANATTGYISKQNALYKTTNGGTNFTSISNSLLSGYDNVICTKSNGDVYIIQDHSYKVYKYSSSQGFQTIKDFSSTYAILYMEFSKLNDNTIYVCGEKYSSPYNPFLAKSNDGGTTWVTILDGSVNTNDAGYIDNMSVTNNGSYDIVKLSARYKLIEYNSNTGNTNDLTSDWSAGNRISFGDQNNGYFLNYDGGQDEPPSESGTTGVYRTTNGGVNWTVEVGNPGAGYFFNTVIKFYSRGQMTYFTRSGGNIANFYNRKLNTNLNTFYDNISVSGTISMNNNPFNTPYSGFIRGGAYTFSSSQIINSGQSDERILYKWSNNINSHGTYQYPLYYEDIFSSYYKTKFISNIQNAISNGSLPKSFRDTNNVINQVHESMGGVFYSRSTDNGTSFSREEIVNYLDKNKENKNAFISEIKQGNSTFEPYSEGNIIAIYQYREGNNEIFKCLYKNIVPPNYKQWEELSVLNFSFTSQNPFNAKARIFAQQGTSNIPNNQNDLLTITTYLYPNGNTVELKVKVGGGYPYQQEFTIDEGNIVTDYSVTRSTQGQYQVLYFAYIKNNEVWYKCFKFHIAYQQAYCEVDPNCPNPTEPISAQDGQSTKISPDISLKNGYPIITYRGQHSRNWAISIEGNYEDNWITVNLYPVVVRYKTGSSSWSDFKKYESDGQHVNEQPNVEGSKDANGYLINYKSAPSLNKQFVKLDAGGNYRCDPPTFSGVDAKLVRGCYTGLTGGSSYPMLLTLKQNTSNNLLYDVGKQSFVITDQGTVFDYGYDNMDGVIEKNDANYIFSIGPIFASNTTYGFDDSEPPMTIQNAVDFNSNMVSDNFSLSDNDTLIIGAFGSYVSRSLENFQPMKFQVDLISSTTGEHLRVLFRDTVKLEDSVEAEYLRGFIITGIPNGTDSFYVQLSVDTLDGGDGDGYGMGGVYVPDENLGDNNVSFKRRIHFEKGNPIKPVNNIPKEYSLSQNYPNPFNPVTNIKYQIPVNGFVSLKIYDITGREIANLVKEYKQAGNYTVSFNGSNLASSVYFYRIQSGDFMQVKKMVLVK